MDTLFDERAGQIAASRRTVEASASAVSWPAIIAGAVVAASVSLILLALGSGLRLASVSPWPNSGASATTFTVMTAIWLIVVQWLASAASSMVGAGTRAAATVASGAAQGVANSAQSGTSVVPYDVDMLFRSTSPDTNASTSDARAEAHAFWQKGWPRATSRQQTVTTLQGWWQRGPESLKVMPRSAWMM